MCAKWAGEYDVKLLLQELEVSRKRNEDTGEFEGFEGWNPFEDVTAVLHSCVKFAHDMTETDRSRIIYRSVLALGRVDDMTSDALIAEINRREGAFQELDERRFVLATSISIRPPNPLRNTSVSGHRITFGRYLPKRFATEHEKARELGRRDIFGEPPKWWSMFNGYSPVRVSVRARSISAAYEQSIGALDLLRGIWNLRLNKAARTSMGKRKPVNVLHLGPIHSLHEPDGRLATESYWYDPGYVEPLKNLNLHNAQDELRDFEKLVRKYLSKSQYRQDIEGAITRYTRILDSREWNSAFVQLWSLLEYLTDTTNAPNDTTVKRALFFWHRDERDFHRQVLKHLMKYRNRTVHAGFAPEDIETSLYQLKRYVERVLLFHVFSAPDFASIGEVAEMMQLPLADMSILRRRRWLMDRALKYHS
ncbi:hypothetical protein GBA63_11135 [Rubrobacter tropicus]|uniref:Apea-like HEPN domain-containing protein n=1 Tax=Rubrobacter tropicus TaxID=2653851 RepID=A0A6G8Q9J0_9ACTN|nr:hypothetical protein [Rubrobacter tropicus]QIN83136.1 hypothetical protein GBA63_11135 [Rubrobacter tropicus]